MFNIAYAQAPMYPVFYARHISQFITSPLILLDLFLVSGVSNNTRFFILFANAMAVFLLFLPTQPPPSPCTPPLLPALPALPAHLPARPGRAGDEGKGACYDKHVGTCLLSSHFSLIVGEEGKEETSGVDGSGVDGKRGRGGEDRVRD